MTAAKAKSIFLFDFLTVYKASGLQAKYKITLLAYCI